MAGRRCGENHYHLLPVADNSPLICLLEVLNKCICATDGQRWGVGVGVGGGGVCVDRLKQMRVCAWDVGEGLMKNERIRRSGKLL